MGKVRYISGHNINDKDVPDEYLYDKNGNVCDDINSFFAKIIEDKKPRYYLYFDTGGLVDPKNDLCSIRKRSQWRLKQVGLKAFESYIEYLKTNKKSKLDYTRRIINETV